MYKLRTYQEQAVAAGLRYFSTADEKGGGGVIVLPTGAGKSLVIANIALGLKAPILVLQPSKEILEQNMKKLADYGYYDIGVFSASFNRKEVRSITFATIGSIVRKTQYFEKIRYCVIDECHGVDPKGGMYESFLAATKMKVLGLTATPYRLYSSQNYGSMLRFITRTRPRIFTKVLYYCQIGELAREGFLAPLNYYNIKCVDASMLQVNSNYSDYTDESVRRAYEMLNFSDTLVNIVQRLLLKERTVLVFTRFVQEAEYMANKIGKVAAVVTGKMAKKEREETLARFKAGELKVIANVGVLTTGFDFPALDTIVLARPTMSLALYYQMIGRAIRPYPDKVGWIVDLCGSYLRFGKVADMELRFTDKNQPAYYSGDRQLTNVFYTK